MTPPRDLRGSDLLRALNKCVQETIEAWALEQDYIIKHDGAHVTIMERFDVYRGYTVQIKYPFTFEDK